MTPTCASCSAPATLVLADNSYQWDFCTEDAAAALKRPFGWRIIYVWPANGVARELLPAEARALLR